MTIKCPAHANWTYCLLLPRSDQTQKFEEGGDRRQPTSPCLTADEKDKMIKLQQWFFAKHELAPSGKAEDISSRRGQSAAADTTLSAVKNREFCDLTVEVSHLVIGVDE